MTPHRQAKARGRSGALSATCKHTQQVHLALPCCTSASISSAGPGTGECTRASTILPGLPEGPSAGGGGWVSVDRWSSHCRNFSPEVTPSRPHWICTIRHTRAVNGIQGTAITPAVIVQSGHREHAWVTGEMLACAWCVSSVRGVLAVRVVC